MKILHSLLFFILLLVILTISLFGVLLPQNTLVSPVGAMQIAPFDTGLSLFQNNKGKFYTLSPFNDYFVENGVRTSLITINEIEAKNYRTNLEKNKFESIYETLKSYFRLDTPSIEFYTSKNISYDTKIGGNKLFITKSVSNLGSNSKNVQGFSIPFNSNDFLFDDKLNLYTYIPDRQLNLFELISHKKLNSQLEMLEITIPTKTIYIFNTQMSGVIAIKATEGQTIKINRNTKFIEIEQEITPNNGIYTQQLQIEILDSLRQI